VGQAKALTMAQVRVAATVERELLAELGGLFPGERLVSAPDELFVYECDA